jgi:hypothetical protein
MSTYDHDDDVTEQNIQRLLDQAYRPEAPDPGFVRRLTDRLCATARDAAQTRPTLRAREAVHASRRQRFCALAAAASLTLVALGLDLLVQPRRATRSVPSLGVVRRAPEGAAPAKPPATTAAPMAVANYATPAHPAFVSVPAEEKPPQSDEPLLMPRPRPAAGPVELAALGRTVQTGAAERRRVELVDGSVLYLNRDTTLEVVAERKVKLKKGEVFVEVSPRPADAEGATFAVQTGDRQVTALGTKFDVRAGKDGTGVVVTQGKVSVSGPEEPVVQSGQELAPGDARPEPAPRASYVLDWTRDLMAAADSPLVPQSKYAGGALVALAPGGQETSLSLHRYHVDVHIEDGFARTTIDQIYFNAEAARLEGTFYFPLPADASLSRLAMYVDGRLMEGGMAEREYAQGVFEAIVRRQKDPALLEWVDGTTFKMRVFPLEPRQEKRILLSYTQRLPSLYGRSQYRFPAGHSLGQAGAWSFHARVKNGAGLDWSSPSHQVTATTDGGDLCLDGAAGHARVDKDVVLVLTDRDVKTGTPARFSAAESEGRRYLMLRYRPALAAKAQRQRRDLVFLFESSGDRDPLLARAQVEVVRTLLANAEHDDTFTVLTAGSRVHAFAAEPKPATPENVRAALDFLEHTHLVGALDLGGALAAAEPFLKAGKNPYLVHLGSGLPALGERREEVLARRLPEGTHYVGVAVGKRWARTFMNAAAERSDGYVTQINPDEPIRWRAFELSSTLNTPRLLDVRVVDDSETLHFLTGTTALAQGEELWAVTRINAAQQPLPKSLSVSGTLDGKPYREVVPVKDVAGRADYLPRTWAKLEIDRLLAADMAGNREQLIALSKAMYVMTPYTSLLVLENEQMYAQYNVDRGRKDHWALYDPAPDLPVRDGGRAGGMVARREVERPAPAARPTAEQVLGTVLVRVPAQALAWPGRGDPTGGRRVVTAAELYTGAFALPEADNREELLDLPLTWSDMQNRGLERDKDTTLGMQGAEKKAASGLEAGLAASASAPPGLAGGPPAAGAGNGPTQLPRATPKMTPAPNQAPAEARPAPTAPESMEAKRGGTAPVPPAAPPPPPGAKAETPSAPGGMMPPASFGGSVPTAADGANAARLRSAHVPGGSGGLGGGGVPSGGLAGMLGGFGGPGSGAAGANSPGGSGGNYPGGLGGGSGSNFGLGFNGLPYAFFGRTATANGMEPTSRSPYSGVATYQLGLPTGPSASSTFRSLTQKQQGIELNDQELARQPLGQELLRKTLADETRRSSRMLQTLDDRRLEEFRDGLKQPLGEVEAVARDAPGPALDLKVVKAQAREQAEGLQRGDSGAVEGGVARFLAEGRPASPLYERPSYSRNDRLFIDLLSYAPGLNTTRADIEAVLEAEAGPPVIPGTIDAGARRLIDVARGGGWRKVAFAGWDGRPSLTLVCDHGGRYAYEHTLATGLVEHVVCDGTTLLHLYPELGVAARRTVSRFHRAEFAALVPWVLPPVEDLARDADVRCLDGHTVAVLPHGPARVGLHLIFASDGRLAERSYVELPSGRVLRRETYGPSDIVWAFDADGGQTSVRHLAVADTIAPKLAPNTQSFVVLPLPLRTREHVLAVHGAQWQGRYDTLDPSLALELIAADRGDGNGEPQQILQQRFVLQGDRRPGFATLAAASGALLEVVPLPDAQPAARFTRYLRWLRQRGQGGPAAAAAGLTGLFGRLATFADLVGPWQRGDAAALEGPERDRLLTFVREGRSPGLTWALVSLVLEEHGRPTSLPGGMAAVKRDVLDAACGVLDRVPILGYCARYEQARLCWESGQADRARALFVQAYRRCEQEGRLPPIDAAFRQALRQEGGRPDAWTPLLREEGDRLLLRQDTLGVLTLARQAALLDDQRLADELSATVLRQVAHDPRPPALGVAAIEYLWATHQYQRADALVGSLLAKSAYADRPSLWRLAARLAGERHHAERQRDCLDRALELEYRHLPEEIDLEAVRQDYGTLLGQYERLADALATVHQPPPADLLKRVISAADRWRALDVDGTAPSLSAARILQALGREDLAWDYLTTPLAGRTDDPSAALELARTLAREGSANLADRAFRLAGEADPTNGLVVWERAQNLEQAGKPAEARQVLRHLAEGTWSVQYLELQRQARGRVGGALLLEK